MPGLGLRVQGSGLRAKSRIFSGLGRKYRGQNNYLYYFGGSLL